MSAKIQILGMIAFNELINGEKNNTGNNSPKKARKKIFNLPKGGNHAAIRSIQRTVLDEELDWMDSLSSQPDNPVIMAIGINWSRLGLRPRLDPAATITCWTRPARPARVKINKDQNRGLACCLT